ncbi:hypothetical protein HMPREF3227_00289 [Corynebacterium sp. CMW7794]|uniref:DUF4245 domain-containing protein n=1 Tax=Corynebacterium phoceense TaxID=1686286 RepID=A0A540R512_9CORY|nr:MULTISPECIES: DUF4245 domain-containing protein [Corynebacterium]KXI19670.1 hypothetical protein HMPREF3227_00289 [Corynebacterium sp. CMW7794]MBF9010358.1 DUF4245 domain-containing protein [Corynebacterium phoceense]MCQ9330231.1 DUF4245 domain-containing protein [Corynebacterium phoceense]MCQ9340064.1 DUF4245 domain-containing protein [Corynebacterium phoceense]MCQ9347388.1 DUF4245 domain-containing protein [Corynebacterium phoceense]
MAAEDKPKIFEGGKDMVLSLGVVVIMMLVVVGATGLCTVNPEETNYARENPVDAQSFLDLESRTTETALRLPQVPEGWTPNSARRSSVAGETAAIVGWVTAEEGFIQAAQTAVPLDDALKNYDGAYRADRSSRTVDGTDVQVFASEDADVRPLWGFDLGDERVILTGSASDDDYEALVRAFVAAQPLPN